MTDDKEKSIIVFEFDTVGSTLCKTYINNVTPLQLLAISQYLDFKGKTMLAQQEIEAQANRLTVPTPRIEVPRK